MSDEFKPFAAKRILVALDGSEHSKKALELATSLSKTWNAELYLTHVQEEKKVPEGFEKWREEEGDHFPKANYFDMVCQRDQFLGEAETKAKAAGTERVEVVCAHGDPAEEIILAIKENGVDLVVLGNRGLGTFSRTLMGSVSMKVCTHAPCTCIVVR